MSSYSSEVRHTTVKCVMIKRTHQMKTVVSQKSTGSRVNLIFQVAKPVVSWSNTTNKNNRNSRTRNLLVPDLFASILSPLFLSEI